MVDHLDDGGDGHESLRREAAIETLDLLVGDAQERMLQASVGDLDPSEVYLLAFAEAGLDPVEAQAVIDSSAELLGGELYDLVGSRGFAVSILKDALAQVEERMVASPAP